MTLVNWLEPKILSWFLESGLPNANLESWATIGSHFNLPKSRYKEPKNLDYFSLKSYNYLCLDK